MSNRSIRYLLKIQKKVGLFEGKPQQTNVEKKNNLRNNNHRPAGSSKTSNTNRKAKATRSKSKQLEASKQEARESQSQKEAREAACSKSDQQISQVFEK